MQTIFDSESFSFTKIPNACGDRCAAYDFRNSTNHLHCEATMGPNFCNAMVRVVGDGPDRAWAVEAEDGCVCAQCKLVACKACTHPSIDGTRKLCSDCALNERKRVEDAIRMDQALTDIERGLEVYLECLATEQDELKIKRSVLAFQRIDELVERVHSQILPNIERASGLQITLPVTDIA